MSRILIATATLTAVVATSAQAATVYTGFDGMTTGALNQKSGSGNTGFSGSWSGSATSSTNSTATVVGGNPSGMPAAFTDSFGTPSGSNYLQTNNSPAFRALSTTYDTEASNTFYVSFLFQATTAASGGGLSFFNSAGNELIQFGPGPGSPSNNANRTFRINLPSSGTNLQGLNGSLDEDTTFWLVGKVSTANGNDTISLTWFTGSDTVPVSETFDITLSGANIGSTLAAGARTISQIRLNSPDTHAQQFDEIRIGESWEDVTGVPEPASLSLLGLAGLAMGRRRRA
jgi:hypothetical protein